MKLGVIFVCIIAFFACKKQTTENPIVYRCSAENRQLDEQGNQVFKTENLTFSAAESQCADFARSGSYSIKLDSIHQYGMPCFITGVKSGEFFKASVWQKIGGKKGTLVADLKGRSTYRLEANQGDLYTEKDGWILHTLQFKTLTAVDTLAFFIFGGGDHSGVTYFDDLRIERFDKQQDEEFEEIPILKITLADSAKNKLNKFIASSINEEAIASQFKKYVPAILVDDENNYPIEMRLKGDWTDHLRTGTPSYRIKLDGNESFMGLRSFSVQHPSTRNYLHEWFLHKLCDGEGLLATTYEYIKVTVNDQNEGVHAIEEHFDKELIESRNRREGPILKIDESAFWESMSWNRVNKTNISLPYYESALVSCFKKKRTRKSKVLFDQFKNGAVLVTLFKNYYEHPEDVFDLDQLALYYALMDLGNVHHSLAWHNRRFYYNPITAKLEHIGFDMIPMMLPMNKLLATREFERDLSESLLEERLDVYIFRNEQFREKYVAALKRVSSEAYLDSAFARIGLENLAVLERDVMGSVFQNYTFDRAMYYEKANLIRQELLTLDERWDKYMEKDIQLSNLNQSDSYRMDSSDFYMKDISINPYLTKINDTCWKVELENYHFDSVSITGYKIKSDKTNTIAIPNPIKLRGFKGGDVMVDTASFLLTERPYALSFMPHNLKGIAETKKFIKWQKPKEEHPRIELKRKFKKKSPYYRVENNLLTLKKEVVIDQLIYVPQGICVKIEAGTNVDFVNGGGLIINDATQMNGTEEQPIIFKSSDTTGMGITILNAPTVKLNHVAIENMNTLNYKGWTLTGALTIYESDVHINGLKISGVLCEDGLNIVRSNFELENCTIKDTKSDGFDADFCTGTFTNSSFINTGNDCIDFSGSEVAISGIQITNSGDKGISAGEKSRLTVKNIEIDGAITGIASKDGSLVDGDKISVRNAKIGVAIFRKKLVYDHASINLEHVEYKNVVQLALIEKGATVQLGDQLFKGYQHLNIEKMYERFDKK